MLREFLQEICKELTLATPKLNEHKVYPFRLNSEVLVDLKDLDPEVAMEAVIFPPPTKETWRSLHLSHVSQSARSWDRQ